MDSNEASTTGSAVIDSTDLNGLDSNGRLPVSQDAESAHAEPFLSAETTIEATAAATTDNFNKVVQFPAGRYVRPPHRITLRRRNAGRGNGVIYMSSAVTKRNAARFEPLLADAPAPAAARPETTIIFGPAAWDPTNLWGGPSFGGLSLPPSPRSKREALSLVAGAGSLVAGAERTAEKVRPVLMLLPGHEA